MFYNFTLNEDTHRIVIMKKLLITFFTVLFCLISSVGWSVESKDLIYRDGLFYKKFSDVPFTGKTTGKAQISYKNGKLDGSYVSYYSNGQLQLKGDFKNGKKDGSWVSYYNDGRVSSKGNLKNGYNEGYWVWYNEDGTIFERLTGTYKKGKKISD